MKFNLSIALIVLVGVVACSNALPARKRMVYFQQPSARFYSAPQRLMYVAQYVQPQRTHARSTQAASALVAGESVATGTYLKDCDHTEADIAASAGPGLDVNLVQRDEETFNAGGGAQSVAEAYPPAGGEDQGYDAAAAGAVGADDAIATSNDDAKVPRDFNFDAAEAEVGVSAGGYAGAAGDFPAPAPLAPVGPPARRYLPSNKKVYVELDHNAEGDEIAEDDTAVSDDESAAEEYPARVPNARRPAAKRPTKQPPKGQGAGGACATCKGSPSGTFFPIDFGGTSGGAIAIANSLSTGEGGSATSHAIAYGSPDAARARSRGPVLTKRH